MKWSDAWELIKEDFHYSISATCLCSKIVKIFFDLEFQVLLLYRLIIFFRTLRRGNWLIPPLFYLQQVLSGCQINPYAKIGRRVRFPHPTGIVIGENVQIGDDVKVFQHVTLGSHGKPGQETGYPVVESDVTIFAGATIIGFVHIGCGAIIGTGALVLNDVPPYAIVAGMPARILRFRTDVDGNDRLE